MLRTLDVVVANVGVVAVLNVVDIDVVVFVDVGEGRLFCNQLTNIL